MIYLIGGPPKCGKTTLTKTLSRRLLIPYVSTDTLQSVIKPYVEQEDINKLFPASLQKCDSNDEKFEKYSSDEIIKAYHEQARTIYSAIDMFALCEITDGNDYIIEGYHIEPELVSRLIRKYPNNVRAVFLTKTDEEKFSENIRKSTTPNDWILSKTQKKETYIKISRMICRYGGWFEEESKKYEMNCINMNYDFGSKTEEAINYLTSK